MNHNAFTKFDLTGRTGVVTAGATGMGYYMARGLARSGAKVVIAQRSQEIVEASAQRLREESGGEIIAETVEKQSQRVENSRKHYVVGANSSFQS